MNKVFFNLEQSAAFTGHRKVPYGKQREVELKLNKTIREHYKKGIRDFLCGMAFGFDMFAAEAVINLKKELPHIRLIAVVPYRGQCERWSAILQSKYRELLNQADRAIILSEQYFIIRMCSEETFFPKYPNNNSFPSSAIKTNELLRVDIITSFFAHTDRNPAIAKKINKIRDFILPVLFIINSKLYLFL